MILGLLGHCSFHYLERLLNTSDGVLGSLGVSAPVFPSASLENEELSSCLCIVLEEVFVSGSVHACKIPQFLL